MVFLFNVSLTLAIVGSKFAYPKNFTSSGTEVSNGFWLFDAIHFLLTFSQWRHALRTSFFNSCYSVVEVFPPLSHYSTITSVFNTVVRHCRFTLLFVCVGYCESLLLFNIVKNSVISSKIIMIRFAIYLSSMHIFQRHSLEYLDDANKLFLTAISTYNSLRALD
jgi:hypothetical protein